jgi:hypothetical protein
MRLARSVAAWPDARHELSLFEWSTMINAGDDDRHSVSVVGLVGEVIVGTTDPKRPGEVRIAVRGGSETFIAYCTEPLIRHSTVLVIEELGSRRVVVTPWMSM